MERRVVITGCSSIPPIGRSRSEILRSLTHGISGVKTLREDDVLTKYILSKVFGTVDTTAVNITKMFGITGRVISSCTTSSQSIGFGYEMVKFGMQDTMLCGGGGRVRHDDRGRLR